MSAAPQPPSKVSSRTADGSLIGLLTVSFYVLFTLLPSSHSLMVSWPWVAVWQVALLMPIIWLLWQLWFKPLAQFKLGSGLDWPIVLLVIGLALSTLLAEFPNQSRWYSWAALGGIAALYALSGWLKTPQQAIRLLKFQAVLGLAFILVSLGLWLFQTYFPELERLAALEPYGVAQQFNFGITSLRNWYPLGHQNYVAGYLVLILPLLFGLAITDHGWQRWLWSLSCCLGLVDLYTASSRGGLLALVVTVAIALVISLFRSQLSRRFVLPAGGLLLCVLIITTLGNSRVRRPLLALLQGKTNNSELGYRTITNVIGWHIGLDHPLTGAGPGSVLQLFQKYRPYWAGREAELHFQLHSTPAQVWAELGFLGMAVLISLVGVWSWLTWRWAKNLSNWLSPALTWSLVAGLFAYGLMSLTDYQLDTPAISGTLIIYLVALARVYALEIDASSSAIPRKAGTFSRICVGLGLSCVLAVNLWLIPVHRAWAISKQGFEQLSQGNFDGFEQSLTQSHRLAPWEPYYPSILAWVLGDFSFQTQGESRQALRTEAIDWFKTANSVAPYQEFGQSNLGWLLSQENPDESVTAFANSAQLIPTKQGVFLGLGLALLRNNQSELAAQALVLELLRFPLQITSPIWQLGELARTKEIVFDKLENHYAELIKLSEDASLVAYLKQQQGGLHWWRSNYTAAAQSWKAFPTGQTLIQLAQKNDVRVEALPEDTINKQVILAWLLPEQRYELVQQLLIKPRNDLPGFDVTLPSEEKIEEFLTSLNQAISFDDWVKNRGPIEQPRTRRVGFGTLNRHIDGPLPLDYSPKIVNQPAAMALSRVFYTPSFFPEFDHVLQVKRQKLFSQVNASN